jgi:hypothetical protein
MVPQPRTAWLENIHFLPQSIILMYINVNYEFILNTLCLQLTC